MLTALDELLLAFLDSDADAHGWSFIFPDESEWESPDCDLMSARFLELARTRGFAGHLIRADSDAEGQHWFAVIREPGSEREIAVDWTARQFYNVRQPADDPASIPCPLVFEWRHQYPLGVVEFESMAPSQTPDRST